MGNKLSRKNKKQDNCHCKLREKTGHCCQKECFIAIAPQKEQLEKSLQKYNAEHTIDIIIDYLGANNLTQIAAGDYPYISLIHFQILHMIKNKISPCSIYLKESKINGNNKKLSSRHHNFNNNNNAKFKCWGEIFILFVGPFKSGKTSICRRWISGHFEEEYNYGRYEDNYGHFISLNEKNILYDITDSVGDHDNMENIVNVLINNADFFVLCFAVNDPETYSKVVENRNKILKHKKKKNDDGMNEWGMIIVATKCDLLDDKRNKNAGQYVDLLDEAIRQSTEWNVPFMCVSAKWNENVKLLFDIVPYELWRQCQMLNTMNFL